MKHTYPTWPGWPGTRTAIVAEVGINHGGDAALAWEMIQVAHAHGADFVKLQSYHTDRLLHPSVAYYASTQAMELSDDLVISLFERAAAAGIALVTTPFDEEALALANGFSPSLHKIASMDVDNVPLVEAAAKTRRPIVLSCGMATLDEITAAKDTILGTGNDKLVLLHCVSDYPAADDAMNLAMLGFLQETFDVPVGLSDHSVGMQAATIAASLGAAVIEKHFTTDRSLAETMPDADHEISMEPGELADLRAFCETIPRMMGHAPRTLTPGEKAGREAFRRSLYATKDIAVGEAITPDNVALLRPVSGIPAGAWRKIVGRKATQAVAAGEPITYSSVGL